MRQTLRTLIAALLRPPTLAGRGGHTRARAAAGPTRPPPPTGAGDTMRRAALRCAGRRGGRRGGGSTSMASCHDQAPHLTVRNHLDVCAQMLGGRGSFRPMGQCAFSFTVSSVITSAAKPDSPLGATA